MYLAEVQESRCSMFYFIQVFCCILAREFLHMLEKYVFNKVLVQQAELLLVRLKKAGKEWPENKALIYLHLH